MNSVITFTAAQLYTVSSIMTLIHYSRADIQFSTGKWSLFYAFFALYYAKKNNMPFVYKG